jgi:DNA-binding transcriptional LysR family regulator
MTLTQLHLFATIVECGSFTGAGEALGMTQSAVSHALASLEAELNVVLLQRERTGVILTEAGQRILLQAKEIVACVETIRQEASLAHGLAVGKIRLGTFPSVSARFLPGVLRRFRQRYPGVEVVLFEGTDQEVQAWLDARTIDIGVVTLPTEGSDVVVIGQDEWLAVVPSTHPLGKKRTVALSHLAQEPFLMSRAGCEPFLRELFAKAKVKPHVQYGVREMPTLLAMIQEEIGVSIVPAWSIPFEIPRIKTLHLHPSVYRQLALAVPSLERASPAVKLFLEQAQQWAEAQGFLQDE